MNFKIRDAITANMTNNSAKEVQNVVEDAIQRGEEHLLPGLGVFFENLWQQADSQEKEKIALEIAETFATN